MQLNAQTLIPLVAVGGTFLVGIFALLGWVIVSTSRTRERERTRREVAAYVAEGTISIEIAERLLAEHTLDAEKERTRRGIASSVAEGSLSVEDAERLIAADKPPWERPDAWGGSIGHPSPNPRPGTKEKSHV